MNRRTLIPLLILFLLSSCASPDAGRCPVDLDELAPLVSDLQLADALSTEIPVNVRDSVREVYFDNILAQYNTDRRSFDSLTWIVRSEPAWVDELYTKVGILLAKEELED